MMLDATAGNRSLWPNKHPPNVVFLDKETRLARPPHVFADFRFCPFRDKVFDCVLFDPPHYYGNIPPWFDKPGRGKNEEYSSTAKSPKSVAGWYGSFKNRRTMVSQIAWAQKEFARISDRLCFKWSEVKISLWNILGLFSAWKEVYRMEYKSPYKFGKQSTYWITFIVPPKSRLEE